MICVCDVCKYIFNSDYSQSKFPIPKRCPHCKRMRTDAGHPAVRTATKRETELYWDQQRWNLDAVVDSFISE